MANITDPLFRLRSQLLTTGLQQKDNNLYQVIDQLIQINANLINTILGLIPNSNNDTPMILNYGVASITLVDSQIRSANSFPVSFNIEIPIAGNVIVPIWWFNEYVSNGNAFSGDPAFHIQYDGIATDLFAALNFGLNDATSGSTHKDQIRTPIDFARGATDPANTQVLINSSADITGGAGSLLRTSLFYYTTAC